MNVLPISNSIHAKNNVKRTFTENDYYCQNVIGNIVDYQKAKEFIDKKYGLNSKNKILVDMSKYSFSMIATMRNQGIKEFLSYVAALKKIGLNCTMYFHIYVIGLLLFGTANCTRLIRWIKVILGKTPSL
jgi:hypothetical protein